MKTLEFKDLDKINDLITQIRKSVKFQNYLLNNPSNIQVTVKINDNDNVIGLVNNIGNEKYSDNEWKLEFHKITKDYLATLQVHANTLIQCNQEELLQILKSKQKDQDQDQLYQIDLQTVGHAKLNVVKTIKNFIDIDIRGAKRFADNTPCVINKKFTKSVAQEFVKELTKDGATASCHIVN